MVVRGTVSGLQWSGDCDLGNGGKGDSVSVTVVRGMVVRGMLIRVTVKRGIVVRGALMMVTVVGGLYSGGW